MDDLEGGSVVHHEEKRKLYVFGEEDPWLWPCGIAAVAKYLYGRLKMDFVRAVIHTFFLAQKRNRWKFSWKEGEHVDK